MTSETLPQHSKLTNEQFFELLSENEKEQIQSWNNTASHFNDQVTCVDLFETQAAEKPHKIALRLNENTISYKELNDRANQVAHYLKNNFDLTTPKIIGLCFEPSFELFISLLAILKSGCAYLPLDATQAKERLQTIVGDANVNTVLTDKKYHGIFSSWGLNSVCLNEIPMSVESKSHNLNLTIKANSIAYVIYTSGSTGKPKGVLVNHNNINHFIHWFYQAIQLKEEDIFDYSSPITFDFTVATTLFPLSKGSEIVICPENTKKDPLLFLEYLSDNRITVTKLTPSYFRQLNVCLCESTPSLDLRLIVTGGESLYKSDLIPWLEKFPNQEILNEYGPTEATVATTWILLNKNNLTNYDEALPIGKPVLNSQIYILNEQLQCVPIGQTGEIYIGGKGVTAGYLNQTSLTAKKFIKNPFSTDPNSHLYKTGDIGNYRFDGLINFLGRTDHQVKVRGFRIELNEITAILMKHPDINQGVCVVKESGIHDKYLVGYYSSKKLKKISNRELREYLLQHLPEYMIPSFFIHIKEFPLTKNGKVDLKALSLISESKENSVMSKSYLTGMEKKILSVWQSIFHRNNIQVNDHFIELGGDSLTAARMMNKLRQITGRDIHVIDIYNYPTIAEMAKLILEKKLIEIHSDQKSDKKNTSDSEKKIPLSEMQLLFWILERLTNKVKTHNLVKRIRVEGYLDAKKLQNAFLQLLKKHSILNCRIHSIPVQAVQKNIKFEIEIRDCSNLSSHDQENWLKENIIKLQKVDWAKERPLLTAHLFYLNNATSELQLAVDHIVADDVSISILLEDLSNFYNEVNDNQKQRFDFFDYINLEQKHLVSLKDNITFWESYLKNGSLIPISVETDLSNLKKTSYFLISNSILKELVQTVRQNKLGLADVICGVVALSLKQCFELTQENLMVNFVKSTRDSEEWDRTVGLFLTNELLKINLQANNLFDFINNVKFSRLESASYQTCPGILKLASAVKKDWEGKKIRIKLVELVSKLISGLIPSAKLNWQVLSAYGKILLAQNKDFYVNINLLHTFLNDPTDKNYFGFNQIALRTDDLERLEAKNVLDFSFERDATHQARLVLSCNIPDVSREQIGNNVIKNLASALVCLQSRLP